MKELLDQVRVRPGQFTDASSGLGGAPHLAAEMVQCMGNARIEHVPYKGRSLALAEVIGGQVPMLFSNTVSNRSGCDSN